VTTGTEHIVGGHLTVRIVTPEATAFEGKADMVVVPSHDGETAFLPKHAAFVGLLGAGECRFHVPDGGTHHFFLAGGVVQVVDDVVTVLAETVIPAAALDPAKAEREFEAASALPGGDEAKTAARDKALGIARAKRRVAAKLAALPGGRH
jgi:F-type H+-transporting ATPase subunit epsilon